MIISTANNEESNRVICAFKQINRLKTVLCISEYSLVLEDTLLQWKILDCFCSQVFGPLSGKLFGLSEKKKSVVMQEGTDAA